MQGYEPMDGIYGDWAGYGQDPKQKVIAVEDNMTQILKSEMGLTEAQATKVKEFLSLTNARKMAVSPPNYSQNNHFIRVPSDVEHKAKEYQRRVVPPLFGPGVFESIDKAEEVLSGRIDSLETTLEKVTATLSNKLVDANAKITLLEGRTYLWQDIKVLLIRARAWISQKLTTLRLKLARRKKTKEVARKTISVEERDKVLEQIAQLHGKDTAIEAAQVLKDMNLPIGWHEQFHKATLASSQEEIITHLRGAVNSLPEGTDMNVTRLYHELAMTMIRRKLEKGWLNQENSIDSMLIVKETGLGWLLDRSVERRTEPSQFESSSFVGYEQLGDIYNNQRLGSFEAEL